MEGIEIDSIEFDMPNPMIQRHFIGKISMGWNPPKFL
jgi:hypothetical protein